LVTYICSQLNLKSMPTTAMDLGPSFNTLVLLQHENTKKLFPYCMREIEILTSYLHGTATCGRRIYELLTPVVINSRAFTFMDSHQNSISIYTAGSSYFKGKPVPKSNERARFNTPRVSKLIESEWMDLEESIQIMWGWRVG
jgi:hypothetical protein